MHNTNRTDTAATESPTLAELLQRRAEERAEQERENARREMVSRENDRREALDYIAGWIAAHVSPELAAALRMNPAVDDNRIDEDPDEYGPAAAGYVQLDLRGVGVDAGVDDGEADGDEAQPPAQRDPDHDDRWRISLEHVRYSGYHWTLRGPRGYAVRLPVYRTDEKTDGAILDAIAAYPAWLDGEAERRAAREAQEREQTREQERKRPEPRHYVSVQGGPNGGMLNRGNRLRVTAYDPTREGGTVEVEATIEEATEMWLLLTVGDHQRLIPVARVIEIVPAE